MSIVRLFPASVAIVLILTRALPAWADGLFREDKAGSTHVAVVSVIPWDEYIAELQPSFDMNETQALEEVEKERRSMESILVDAVRNRFDLALPTSSSSSSASRTVTSTEASSTAEGVTTGSSSEETTSTETSGREEKPGDVSTTPSSGTSVAGQAITPALGDESPEIGGIDPMLKYQAATALYQEVRLLNKYVEKAVQRTGYRPFIVRTQVTVTPRARNKPYDVYTNISFFSESIDDHYTKCFYNPNAPGCSDAASYSGKMSYREQIGRVETMMGQETVQELRCNADPQEAEFALARNPYVIPLLVTDSLESTLHSQVTDRIRQFAFGLSFLIQGFGGKNEFERFKRNLERVLGRDFNSLMTVARLSDNTYRVRLGAMQQVDTDYATIPRNHYVTFLLLAPCSVTTIGVASQSQWIHATSGRILEPLPLRQVEKKLKKIAKDYAIADLIYESGHHDFVALLRENQLLVLQNKYGDFRRRVSRSPVLRNPREFPYDTLWNALVSIMPLLNFASTSFELRLPSRPDFDPGDVLLLDDGKKSTTIVRGRGFLSGHMDAVLRARDLGSGRPVPVPSESVTVRAGGKEAAIAFPSLKALDKAGKIFDLRAMDLEVVCRGCTRDYCYKIEELDVSAVRRTYYLPKPKDDQPKPKKNPGFTLETTAKSIVADPAGTGTVRLALTISTQEVADPRNKSKKVKKALCKRVRLKPRGGDVVEIAPAPGDMLRPDPSQYEFVKSGRLVLKLENLSVEHALSFSATCVEGEGKGAEPVSLSLPVRLVPDPTVLPVRVSNEP